MDKCKACETRARAGLPGQCYACANERTRGEKVVLPAEPDYLLALQVQMVEGTLCVMVECQDYDHFRSLPQVVSYHGAKLGKTGWNSDTHHAFYQSNALMVRVEKR